MSIFAEAERIIEEEKELVLTYDRLTDLLSYPEISADAMYYKHLFLKRAEIEKAHTLYCDLQDAILLVKEAEGADILYAPLNALKQEIVKLSDDGTHAAEIALYGDEACKNSILSAIYEFSRFNGCKAERTQNGMIVLGIGAYASLKKEIGLHVFYGKPVGEVRVFVFPYSAPKSYSAKDVKITTFHSDGAGGQNVNKVETGVRVTHILTDITVTCRDERSQLQNKRRALELLEARVTKHYQKLQNHLRTTEKKAQEKVKTVFTYTNGRKDI